MAQKFFLPNGDGYFEIVDVAEITSDKKWKTLILCTSDNTTFFNDIRLTTDDDAASYVKALCEKLKLSVSCMS